MLQRMSSSTSWPACRTARSLWHQQRLITKPVSRRRTACIVAFKDARRAESLHSMVTVPRVTNFELLGLERGSSDAQEIKQAYEERVGSQTQAAYSADTLFSRAVLLKSAVECLLDPQRAGIEQKLANSESPGLKVFQSDLPGVLVVLQEVGCHAEVLALGPAWLEQHSSSPDAPDVAACIALAYCDRASLALDALEQQEGSAQVSQAGPSPLLSACEDLERAAQLCRLHDVAHQLQEQIADALKGYAHAYATELVALPLGPECASRRKRGVAIIR
ncbi:hypothetical protein DUNSADRAFT_9690 [Dunaliella salina]|uniref:Plastid division protein CDP1-like 1st alpha solenoid domain-containing protein n=1 Tax=Dunaliella salina TaxID=3046 RepID=A0ABQ7GGX0_DUNSA|nr:hypothetical protein DUNSADRAFT_9690 [Dunaliella salina]|eukprot:KAF5833853.1 hypothetical protein DUNSADRAFT_9690 [Dunaliella salina]